MSQCVAHKKNGEQCRAHALAGTTVCLRHGGNAPQVRRRAAQRLLEASDAAAAYLVATIMDKSKPDAIRLTAARDLLDRAGLGAKQSVEVEVVPAEPTPWERLIADGGIFKVVHELAPGETADADVLDAEVVSDPVPPSDSEAARASYLATRNEPDPMPPDAVQRTDLPRRKVRRR